MKARIRILGLVNRGLLLVLAFSAASCKPVRPNSSEITVFAAASLRDMLQELTLTYEADHDVSIRCNFAGSNSLAQHIVAGAEADLFLSANRNWMDFVEQKGRVADHTRRTLIANQLVVIANVTTDWKLTEIADLPKLPFRFLSMGDPKGVPAGIYAKRYLNNVAYEKRTLWRAVQDRIAPAPDVRRALSLVESDKSLLGIVYRTDAAASSRVRILYEVPADQAAVRYQIALLQPAPADGSAKEFYDFLLGEEARTRYRRHGFLVH